MKKCRGCHESGGAIEPTGYHANCAHIAGVCAAHDNPSIITSMRNLITFTRSPADILMEVYGNYYATPVS